MSRLGLIVILLALPLCGTLAGWHSAPALARTNYIVKVAERVWLEESKGLKERTLESEAFRSTGMPVETIYAQAREIRKKFELGGALFGLWCGLIAAIKIAAIKIAAIKMAHARSPRRLREYDTDPSLCLACARCYLSCPIERERLKEQNGDQSGERVL